MRVAMGLSFNEKNPNLWAKKFYAKMSKFEYLAAGSTNLGAVVRIGSTPASGTAILTSEVPVVRIHLRPPEVPV